LKVLPVVNSVQALSAPLALMYEMALATMASASDLLPLRLLAWTGSVMLSGSHRVGTRRALSSSRSVRWRCPRFQGRSQP